MDPNAYYFPGYPAVPDNSCLYEIKRKAFLLGLDISGTGVRNDFTLPERDRRAGEVVLVKTWIKCAARLGAPVLRVFSGAGVPAGYSREEVTRWVVDGLHQCAEHGRKNGPWKFLEALEVNISDPPQRLQDLEEYPRFRPAEPDFGISGS